MVHKMALRVLPFLFLALGASAQNFPFVQRKTWDGPFDIKMIAAPNLEAVYLDATRAAQGILDADSIISNKTIQMTGDLFEINNRYKEGSPFVQFDIPLPAIECPDPSTPCFQGLTANTPNASCPVRYNNPGTVSKYVSMNYADYDTDMSTYSSSMSLLDISKCAEIEAAYLYWSGNFKGSNPNITLYSPNKSYNGNGANVFNTTTTSGYDRVLFKRPGGAYQNVTATTSYTSSTTYVCVSDVTTIVRGTGGGQFWVGNLQSYPNEGNGGSTSGWVLVVIFRSPLSPPRLIGLWDGFKNITTGNSEAFQLNGLQAPATSNFKSYVGFAALDGENIASQLDGKTPEGLGFQTNAGGPAVSINPFCDGSQPRYKLWTKKGYPATADGSDNIDECKAPVFDGTWASVCDGVSSSHITSYTDATGVNGNEIVRLPANKNTLGFDAHHFLLPNNAVAPNATQATLTVNAGPQGSTLPYMAYVAIERLQPKLILTKKADKDQTATNVNRTYTLKIVNQGNQESFGADALIDTLDPVTNFVPPLRVRHFVNGVPSTINTVTVASTTNNILKLNFNQKIKPKDSVEIEFDVKILPVTDGVAGPLYIACKRTIENIAWITYQKNVANEKIIAKSNSGECNDGSEVKIQIIDSSLDPTPKVLNNVDASTFRSDLVIKHIREELFKQGGISAADTSKFDLFFDAAGNRVYSFTAFPTTGGSATYSTYRDLGGATCQQKVTVTFTFCATPTTPTYAAPAAVCAGTAVSLNKTGTAVGAFYWYDSQTGGTPKANPYSVTPTATTTYYLIDSVSTTGCKSLRTAVTVSVNPVPATPTAPTAPQICANNTARLEKTGTATGAYFWYPSAMGGSPQANPYTTPVLTANATYYLIDSSSSGCKSARVAVTVTVTPGPANPTYTNPTICSGNTTVLDKTGTATGVFFWYTRLTGGTPLANPLTTPALTANTTYYLIDSIPNVGCKSARMAVVVTVNPVITPGAIGTTASICSSTAFNLTETTAASGGDGTYTYKWKSSTTGGAPYTDIAGAPSTVGYNSSGETVTTTFIREVSSSTCAPQLSNPITITVLPGLDPGEVAGAATICYNGTSTLTSTSPALGGNGSFAYEWESSTNGTDWTAVPSSASLTLTTPALTVTTQYRRKVTSGTGTCSVAYSNVITITVHPNFTSGGTIQTDKPLICSGETVNLSSVTLPTGGTGTYTYTWSKTEGTTSTTVSGASGSDLANQTLTAATQTEFTFTRTATSGSCGTQTATVKVTVKPQVDYSVVLGPVASICSTDPNPVIFTATATPSTIGTGTYEWSVGGAIDNTSASASLSRTPSTLTDGAKVLVTLKPSSDMCPTKPSYASNELTLVVASKVIPTVSLSPQVPVCEGTAVTLTAIANSAGTTPGFAWSVTTAGGTIVPGGSTTDSYTYTPAVGDVVSVTVTSSSNCKSSIPSEQTATATLPLTIKPKVVPTVAITADKLAACAGDPVTFKVSTKTNEGLAPTFVWFVGTSGQAETSETFVTSTLTGSSDITVQMTSNAECVDPAQATVISNIQTVVVTPRVAPTTGIFANPSGTICAGESVTFNVAQVSTDTTNGGSGVTYEWLVSGSPTVVSTSPTFTSTTLKDNDVVTVRYISSLRCLINDEKVATNQLTMKVNTPTVAISGIYTFCSDDNAGVLTASDNGSGTDAGTGTGPTYTWTTSSGAGPITGTTLSQSLLKTGDVVTVTLTPGYTCNGTPAQDTKTIVIYPKPVAVLSVLKPEICPGEVTTLTSGGGDALIPSTYAWYKDNALISGNGPTVSVGEAGTYKVKVTNVLANCSSEATQGVLVQEVLVNAGPDKSMYQGEATILEAFSNGNYSYSWLPVSNLSDPTALQPVAKPMENTLYTITATSALGCSASDEVIVRVFVPIRVPNAFSPNGDGKNDNWQIDGLEKYPNTKVKVFNRWGSSIYSDNTGYQVPWDGTHNGSQLASGTYYYVIELKGSPDNTDGELSGSLTIVK